MTKKLISSLAAILLMMSVVSIQANPVKSNKDIVQTAVDAGQFTILTKALEAAGLVDALKTKGKFTVFAPSDAAFEKLPAGTIENLLKPENKEKLRSILLYHVVNKELKAKKISKLDGRRLVTLQRETVGVDVSNGVKINGANVIQADIDTKNGVIHVIDTVLIPN